MSTFVCPLPVFAINVHRMRRVTDVEHGTMAPPDHTLKRMNKYTCTTSLNSHK